jgi:hypothetical protein
VNPREHLSDAQVGRIVQSVNIIFSQQLLGRNAKEVCILVARGDRIYAIEDGEALVAVLAARWGDLREAGTGHAAAVSMYRSVRDRLRGREEVVSILEGKRTFHTFVPFVPNGEFVGAVYVKNEPDFRFITSSVITNYNETSVVYTSLIFLGLVAMFFVSSYTVRERDRTRRLLYEEHEKLLRETITHEKESVFTRRIYHTHHKAEKVMAFIKQDLLVLSPANIEEIKHRITQYANFIARVIYDMKWYEPALQTIRNPIFQTKVNDVLRFIVRNLFQRVAKASSRVTFVLDLDERFPVVHINEFVVWEIMEPLIQNCVVHAGVERVTVTLRTDAGTGGAPPRIEIADNGHGIRPDLLEEDDRGIQKLFLESVSTKKGSDEHAGYGCFIAHDLARTRCGWGIRADNPPGGGARITLTLPG